jgi:hypothetical protein
VTSFVRFYAKSEGDEALPKLLAELKGGADTDAALVAASGAGLATWDGRWRAFLATRSHEPIPALFGLGGEPGDASKLRDLRDRSRLAELLLARQHPGEALSELDRIELAGSPVAPDAWQRAMGDPSVRWLRARALEAAGKQEQGASLVEDPREVLSSYGPWWATRGRWMRLRGDEPTATASFIEAVATDPFDVESTCETLDSASSPTDPARKALCEAAREAGTPEFGAD